MIQVDVIGGQKICLKGVGLLLHQDGLPLIVSHNRLKQSDVSVSWLHVADELQKFGWKNKTILSALTEVFEELKCLDKIDQVKAFLELEYEDQREVIFKDLFQSEYSSFRDKKVVPARIHSFFKQTVL
jgi:hypothetical protein